MTHFFNLFDSAIRLKLILTNYAIMLLNTPIQIEPQHFLPMWKNADYRVCVDEASHTLKTYTGNNNISMEGLYPNLLSGDFRSLKPELLQEYRDHGVDVVETIDDDLTDFHKALEQMAKRDVKVKSIIVIVEPDGRLDHTFANLNTLSRAKDIFGRDVDIYLLTHTYTTWLLPKGSSTIQVPEWIKKFPCGILPFSHSPTVTSTTGLRWNLKNQSIQFDGLVSSSNQFTDDPKVVINTDFPLIWTMTTTKINLYAEKPCKESLTDNRPQIKHQPHDNIAHSTV